MTQDLLAIDDVRSRRTFMTGTELASQLQEDTEIAALAFTALNSEISTGASGTALENLLAGIAITAHHARNHMSDLENRPAIRLVDALLRMMTIVIRGDELTEKDVIDADSVPGVLLRDYPNDPKVKEVVEVWDRWLNANGLGGDQRGVRKQILNAGALSRRVLDVVDGRDDT